MYCYGRNNGTNLDIVCLNVVSLEVPIVTNENDLKSNKSTLFDGYLSLLVECINYKDQIDGIDRF